MGLRTALVSTGDGFLDRVLCVVGAALFAQGPEFIQQYLQRLGGHVDEARRQVGQYQKVASDSGVSLDRLIHQTSTNADPAVAKLGGVMTSAQERLSSLEASQAAIVNASVWERPFAFVRHMDTDIARSTWSAYQPAVPTTIEGIVYAIAGLLIILGLYHLFFRAPVSFGYRRWKRKRADRELAQV